MKHILFLDIDSVVNSEQWYEKTKGRKGHFDPDAIALLNTLEGNGIEVVVSSSWGEDGVNQLKNVGLKLPIIGYTEHYYANWICRGNEIEKWLLDTFGGIATKWGAKYKNEKYKYVILDDSCDMLLGQKDNFVQINPETGITKEDIERIKGILGIN